MDLRIRAVVVSWNRASLTRETIRSLLATATLPLDLVVVDNGSRYTEWIDDDPRFDAILLGENRYPGYAANRGWETAESDATLLLRSDNDTRWLPGWCDEVAEAFADERLGIYGPCAAGDEEWWSAPGWPVGGNAIVRRSLFDAGLRYSEEPWRPDALECGRFTADVEALGYRKRFSRRPAIEYLDDGDEEYAAEVARVRGLPPKGTL